MLDNFLHVDDFTDSQLIEILDKSKWIKDKFKQRADYSPLKGMTMAMIFAKAILNENPIDIFNYGDMQRDFTYIDDISEALVRCCCKPAYPDPDFKIENPEPDKSWAPYRIFNIGNGNPINLMRFIELLEDALGKKAIKEFKPIEPGDVIKTSSENTKLNSWINYKPHTSLEEGISIFAKWYILELW